VGSQIVSIFDVVDAAVDLSIKSTGRRLKEASVG
jgi:hypothetical protein